MQAAQRHCQTSSTGNSARRYARQHHQNSSINHQQEAPTSKCGAREMPISTLSAAMYSWLQQGAEETQG